MVILIFNFVLIFRFILHSVQKSGRVPVIGLTLTVASLSSFLIYDKRELRWITITGSFPMKKFYELNNSLKPGDQRLTSPNISS